MDEVEPTDARRLKLSGTRFAGGRLPVDSLIELQRYQDVVRRVAENEWHRDNPGRILPDDFSRSSSLAISRIEDGSADVFLVAESTAIYAEYLAEAESVVDATLGAAYSGGELPPLRGYPPEEQEAVRAELASLGESLSSGQSIELFSQNSESPQVKITTDLRDHAREALLLPTFLLEGVPLTEAAASNKGIETLTGRVTAVDTKTKRFELSTSHGTVHGWYRNNEELLADLRKVLDTEENGPVTRITGLLHQRSSEPWRFWNIDRVEMVEYDSTEWGESLMRLAQLSSGWAGGDGRVISSESLDAAQAVLRITTEGGLTAPQIGPTEDGGVLLEWIRDDGIKSIEITQEAVLELFSMSVSESLGRQTETRSVVEAARFAGGTK